MSNVAIYTEGGLKLGLGNIYRMLELAKLLRLDERFGNVMFVTSSEDYVGDMVRQHGFECTTAAFENLTGVIAGLQFEILIADKLGIEKAFLEEIANQKTERFKIVLFGNTSTANQAADLVINAIIGTDFTNRIYLDEYNTKYLTGPKYVLLRDEFQHKTYVYKNELKNILLLFGGSDQANFSCRVLSDLLKSPVGYHITIVTGRGYVFADELAQLVKDKLNVKVLNNITNVKEIMLENDFLVTSPGGTMFEAFALGVPCVSLYQNESQKDVFGDFFTAASYDEIRDIEVHINNVYNAIDAYYKGLNKLELGQGKEDIKNNIIALI
jgi:spore coat polysaccharide biosynthesis predicted glycosyltransferase SpsG